MDIGYREVVLRSDAARVLTVLVVAVCAVAEASALLSGDAALALRATAPLGLVAVGSWALFWAPAVRISPAAVVLVNPLRTVTVAWPAIVDVRARWGLELETDRGRFTAWAAPRSGAIGAGRAARLAVRQREVGAVAGPESLADGGAASAAGAIVLRQWESYRDAGLLGAVEGAGVRVVRHGWTSVVLLLLAVGTVAAAVAP